MAFRLTVNNPPPQTDTAMKLEVVASDLSNRQRLATTDNYDHQGHFLAYNPQESAAISNEFATASYRYGHTLIGDVLRSQRDMERSRPHQMALAELFFQAHSILFNTYVHGPG